MFLVCQHTTITYSNSDQFKQNILSKIVIRHELLLFSRLILKPNSKLLKRERVHYAN